MPARADVGAAVVAALSTWMVAASLSSPEALTLPALVVSLPSAAAREDSAAWMADSSAAGDGAADGLAGVRDGVAGAPVLRALPGGMATAPTMVAASPAAATMPAVRRVAMNAHRVRPTSAAPAPRIRAIRPAMNSPPPTPLPR